MTEIIKFEGWQKLELRVGEVKSIGEKIIISCNKDFEIKLDLDVKKEDKIVMGILGDGLVIPVVKGNVPLIPEKGAQVGWKVS